MRLLRVLHYALKTVAYGLCAIGCLYQVASILNIYFSYPSLVFSFVEIMDTLTLPAISLCSNNRIMLSKLRSYDGSFDRRWVRLQDRLQQSANASRVKMAMQRLIDRTIRHLMDSLSVSEFAQLGEQWSDLVPAEHFKCATDPFNLNNKCIKYTNLIESAQAEGKCFTVFRRSENDFLRNIAIKSGLSQSPVIRGTGDALNLEIAEQPFHPNEIFRMMVNFSVNEYTTTNDKIMGYVRVHDPSELPAIRQKNFHIYPGFYYELYVNKETDKYLAKPYQTDCVRYAVQSSDQQGYVPSVLSRETCIMNCMSERTVQSCHCWPPELPYVLQQNSTGPRLKWCSWRDGANIEADNKSESSNWFHYCFSSNEYECTQKCKTQCQVDKYTAVRQSFVWPSDERMEHSTKFNKEFRECCAIVSLRFWSSEQTTLKYEPKYAFVEFISYFGGLLSIWLGFSLVKTYDLLEMVAQRAIKRCRSNGKMDLKIFKRKVRHSQAIRPRVAGYLKTRYNQTSI